jgi:NAD(P)-dependent dehydrogenase (short-subunit alcohol dehydrogenase family)
VKAIRSIKEEIPAAKTVDIQYVRLDLADFSSIKQAAAHFVQNNSRLDVLILNAGILAEPALTTPQGHEIQLGTNHIGHFLLTKLLLPVLLKTVSMPATVSQNRQQEETTDVRVVTLSSIANGITPTSLSSPPAKEEDDIIHTITSTPALLSLTTWQRYAVSKTANVLFATELARRYPTLTSVSVHPGLVSSDIWNTTQATNKFLGPLLPLSMKMAFRSVRSGTLNQLWAAAGARKEELVNGGYYTPVGYWSRGNRWVNDETLARKLWEWTDEETSI